MSQRRRPEELVKSKPLNSRPEEIQLNENEAIKSILGNPPGWLLNWGISLVGLFVGAILIMSWIIKYPDVIRAEVVLTTENPPIRVIAANSGRLDEWRIKDQEHITKGMVIAKFHSTAATKDVIRLEAFLSRIEYTNTLAGFPKSLPTQLRLGELQPGFSSFSEAYKDLLYFGNTNNVAIKIASLKSQIKHIEELNLSQKRQQVIFNKEADIAQKDLERHQYLYKNGGCSEVELEGKELGVLQYQRQLESLQSGITNNQLRIEQMKLQMTELGQNKTDGVVSKITSVKEHAHRLLNDAKSWKEKYLIIAPISGQVALAQVWSAQQFITPGTEVLTIIPPDTSNIIVARAMMPVEGAGKVKPAMRTLVSFKNYPSQEFGTIECKVKHIAHIPQRSKESASYLVSLDLPQDMTTNFDKEIPFQQEMIGDAQIITEDRRILERILSRLMEMLS